MNLFEMSLSFPEGLSVFVSFILPRGCSFVTKAINAYIAGAKSAIIYDNVPQADAIFSMIQDETPRVVPIPCAFMSGIDG